MSPPTVRNGNGFIHMGTPTIQILQQLYPLNKVLQNEGDLSSQYSRYQTPCAFGWVPHRFLHREETSPKSDLISS